MSQGKAACLLQTWLEIFALLSQPTQPVQPHQPKCKRGTKATDLVVAFAFPPVLIWLAQQSTEPGCKHSAFYVCLSVTSAAAELVTQLAHGHRNPN